MRTPATTLKRDDSPAIHATKTVAKALTVTVLLLATLIVLYIAA